MKLLRSWILTALAIMAASWLMPKSFYVDGFATAAVAALVLGLLNVTVKPILHILSLPITFLTFGLFAFVINGIIISLLARLMTGMTVSGFFASLLVAIVISLINSTLNSLVSGKS